MKKTIFVFYILILSTNIFSQGTKMDVNEINNITKKNDIFIPSGFYSGILDVTDTIKLPIIFEFKDDKIFFSSPTQNANDLEVSYKIDSLANININASIFGFSLKGVIDKDKIDGIFYQNGLEIKVQLTHQESRPTFTKVRKQEPTDFNYKREEVTIINKKNNRKYYGTLTIPNEDKSQTALVFITGSGLQNRNEELANHKPFLVISDFLTKNGYYTLRCDDYGYNGEDTSTSTTFDIADDILSQINYLRNYDKIEKIILYGHSEGGIIAQILSSSVDGIILASAPSVSGREIYKDQVKHVLKNIGFNQFKIDTYDKKIDEVTATLINDNLTIDEKKNVVIPFLKELGNNENNAQMVFNTLNLPWYRQFLKLDPRDYIKKIDVPTLVLQGEYDTQVNEQLNIPVFRELLKSKNKIIIYPKYNHLLQKSKTGEQKEYAEIETTIEKNVLDDILYFLDSLK